MMFAMYKSHKKLSTRLVCLWPVFLAACASPPERNEAQFYRCEAGVDFTVRFVDDSAVVNSSRGHEVLHRDAGGLAPGQTVYANPRLRAEFGLGQTGREAVLRYPLVPVVLRCARSGLKSNQE